MKTAQINLVFFLNPVNFLRNIIEGITITPLKSGIDAKLNLEPAS